jgi:hypothetical protein
VTACQDWTNNAAELINTNKKILFHFREFVRLSPNPTVATGQEANLVHFLEQFLTYADVCRMLTFADVC